MFTTKNMRFSCLTLLKYGRSMEYTAFDELAFKGVIISAHQVDTKRTRLASFTGLWGDCVVTE